MKKCPRCQEDTLDDVEEKNALSRRDNKTYIRSACGQSEAMDDFYKYGVGR